MAAKPNIKRIYEPPARSDGIRILIDHIWPRGVSKKKATLDEWFKDIAPSGRLRKWFGHDPARWLEFQRRYRAELKSNKIAVKHLRDRMKQGRVTLLYAARDTEHNHAPVLAAYLSGRGKSKS